MVMADVVEVYTSSPAQERPVNGWKSTSEVRPLTVPVHRNGGIGVMKVREHDNPVVQKLNNHISQIEHIWNNEWQYNVRNKIELEESRKSDSLGPHVQDAAHYSQTNIRRNDSIALVRLEQGRRRSEVLSNNSRFRACVGRKQYFSH